MRNTADVTGGKPIAVLLQSISGAINPLVAFYDIHGGKRQVLFFCDLLVWVTFFNNCVLKNFIFYVFINNLNVIKVIGQSNEIPNRIVLFQYFFPCV
jgi:hypothetical protein